MAIIPRFTSRVLPPGAQPGAIKTAQLRGKAGAGLAAALGDTIIAGVNFKKRKDAEDDAEQARRAAILEELGRATEDLGKSLENSPAFGEPRAPTTAGGIPLEFGESASAAGAAGDKATAAVSNLTARTDQQKQVGATLDSQSDVNWLASFEQSITRTRAAAQATAAAQGGPAKGMALRALAVFDREVAKLSKALEDRPHLKDKFGALVASSRAPMELRLLTQENTLRVVENKAQLFDSLGGLALAAGQDPAMVSGVTGRGFGQIESAMNSGLLTPEEAAAMQQDFGFRVHMSAVRGQIAADPVDAQNRLVAGEFDEFFDDPTLSWLSRDAGSAVRVRAAAASQAERARKRELAFDTTEHLEMVAETGVEDEGLDARARAALPPEDYAAFQAAEAEARERHATRVEYAFMTEEEIESDIAATAPGPGPRDTDEREAAHAIRAKTRDEILAARAADPAGWAMRDEAVAASFAAAEENPDDLVLAGKAIQQRLALQREMGIEQPRLLSDGKRDEIAEELAQASPADRPALIAVLRGRYGAQYDGLVKELLGRVAPYTGVLLAHAGDPVLTNILARGMAMDGVEFKGARVLSLPLVGGRLDGSRLEDKQLYTFMAGDRVFGVVYDRKADALVPDPSFEISADSSPSGAYVPMTAAERAELERRKEEYERENPFWARFGQRLEAGGLNLRNWFGGMTLLTAYSSAIEAERMLRAQEERMAEFEATLPSRGLSPEQIATARALQEREKRKLQNFARSFRRVAEQTVQDMAKTYGELAAIPRNPVAERAVQAESFAEFFDVFMVDPMGVVGQFGIEGLVTSVPSILGGVAGGVAGGPVGAAAGVGAGSALVVYGAKLNEKMLELGADPDDPASFERVAREHEGEIRNFALKWAAIVGLFDAATAGVGATRLVPRGGSVSHVAEAGVQLATQAAGGAAGEAAGQLATDGELRDGEIAAELVTGIFTGAGEVGSFAVTGVRGKGRPGTEPGAELETSVQDAELAPEDTGNAGETGANKPQASANKEEPAKDANQSSGFSHAVGQRLRSLVAFVQQHGSERVSRTKPKRVLFGRVSDSRAEELGERLKQDFGVEFDLRGAVHRIDEDGVGHILGEHKGDQLPFTASDFELMPEIVSTGALVPNTKRSGRNKLPAIVYRKLIGDWFYVVEEVQKKGQVLSVQTAYKTPAPKQKP